MRIQRILIATAALGLLGLPAAQASPSFLRISGIVHDPNQGPLEGVTVTDGTNSTITDAAGYYAIQELQFGNYFISASRAGLTSGTATVTLTAVAPTAHQNFELKYVSTLWLGDQYLSTAATPNMLTTTLKTYAPTPGASCASVLDSRTGQATALIHTGYDGQQTVWTADIALPLSSTEGTFTLTGKVTDCSSGTQIDTGTTAQYMIDNTPPWVNPLNVPPDGGNTAFANQPLLSKIADEGGSGVDSRSVRFDLTDTTVSTTATFTGDSSVVYDPASQWARTPPVPLVAGHTYRLDVSVADRAGNVRREPKVPASGNGFLATRIDVGGTTSEIPPVSCVVAETADPQTGLKAVTCPSVALRSQPAQVDLAGSSHRGIGVAVQTVALSTARVETTIGGQPVSVAAYRANDPAWSPRRIESFFEVAAPYQEPRTLEAPAWLDSPVGTLTTAVPAAWTSAVLRMEPVTTTPSQDNCADPTAGGCGPDPVRMWPFTELPVSAPHFAACDSALTHRQAVHSPPGQHLNVQVAVDRTRFAPSELTFFYAINNGNFQPVRLADAGTSTFEFVVPGAALREGDVVNYGFSAIGAFSPEECARWTSAALPARHSFHVAITASSEERETRRLARAALFTLRDVDPSLEAEAVCQRFFADPTPCQAPAQQPSPDQPAPPTVDLPVVQAGETATGCTRLRVQHENGAYFAKRHTFYGEGYSYSVPVTDAAGNSVGYGTRDYTAGVSEEGASLDSGGEGVTDIGFMFGWSRGSSNSIPNTLSFRIELYYAAAGESHAEAVRGPYSQAYADAYIPRLTRGWVNYLLDPRLSNPRDVTIVWRGVGESVSAEVPYVPYDRTASERVDPRATTWSEVRMTSGYQYLFFVELDTNAHSYALGAAQSGAESDFYEDPEQNGPTVGGPGGAYATDMYVTLLGGYQWPQSACEAAIYRILNV